MQSTTDQVSSPYVYWALKPPPELFPEMMGQERNWWEAGNRRGYWQLLRLMNAQLQGMDPSGAPNQTQQLQFVGPGAKFVRFRVQLARSHIKQRNIIAQGERVSFQCLALNDDFESLSQVPTAQSGLDYVWRAAKGEAEYWRALESDGAFGEGHVWFRWDADAGVDVTKTVNEPVTDPETGEPLMDPTVPGEQLTRPKQVKQKAGTPTMTALYPWDVVRDPLAKNGKSPWRIIREVVSKHEIAMQYPELAAQIMSVNNLQTELGISEMMGWDRAGLRTDQIIVRHFYHEACVGMPEGRYVAYAGDIPLYDLPCPLPEGLPLVTICTARYFGTSFGYPECSDLLSLQEMLDELFTQGANNILKFGNQSLWAEDGVECDMKRLAAGGGFFNYKTGQSPPQTIQWAQIPPATQWMMEQLRDLFGDISGMNSVARGAPEANIQSGTFAALLLNVAQKFVSATEQTLSEGIEDGGNILLKFLQSNADTEFMAVVSGANQQPYMQQFKGSDFRGVRRVQVSAVSALMRQIPGRFEIFNAIKDLPKPDRAAAVQLFTTGDPSGFIDEDQSETLLIQWENEQMMRGFEVAVAESDDPICHNKKHKASKDRLRTLPQQLDQFGQPTQQELMRVRAIELHDQHMLMHAFRWSQSHPIYLDTLQLPRPANPMAPAMTLPTMPALPDQSGANALPPPAQSNAAPPQPSQPDAANPPEEASGDFGGATAVE